MQIIDISMTISEDMPVYKNRQEKRPKITVVQDYHSASSYESRIELDMHTGTHIDAPLHMLPSGSTIDNLDIARFVTECDVIDLTGVKEKIVAEDLQGKNLKPGAFVLLKTRNSFAEHFDPEFVYLSTAGAKYLKERRIAGVGIDSLGIERAQPGHETHKLLFSNNVTIIEGLRLSGVEEGTYQMVALPMKIKGTEAAPARVVLIKP